VRPSECESTMAASIAGSAYGDGWVLHKSRFGGLGMCGSDDDEQWRTDDDVVM